jgi:RNA polymerase sigma factor (sigma-70 family)
MATNQLSYVLQRLSQAALRQNGGNLTDGQLLECFLTRRDEAAFEALVRRHGPMVLGVCRRVLRHADDAEDAFQATFLVLVRKAASVVPRERVGNWLYGVAYRTALAAKTTSIQRRTKERSMKEMPEPTAPAVSWENDWRPLLDQELSRLPEKYRVPVVLCELEGRTRREVAKQLDIPEGTLSSRLATARRLLARRLTRRGLVISAGAVALALAPPEASAALVISTVKAATLLAAGGVATALVSARVAALMEGAIQAMLRTRLKTLGMVLLVLGVLGTGAGYLTLPRLDAQPTPNPRGTKQAPAGKEGQTEKSAVEKLKPFYALGEGEILKRVAPPFPPHAWSSTSRNTRTRRSAFPQVPRLCHSAGRTAACATGG